MGPQSNTCGFGPVDMVVQQITNGTNVSFIELLLIAIKTDETHPYARMETLHIFKPLLI